MNNEIYSVSRNGDIICHATRAYNKRNLNDYVRTSGNKGWKNQQTGDWISNEEYATLQRNQSAQAKGSPILNPNTKYDTKIGKNRANVISGVNQMVDAQNEAKNQAHQNIRQQNIREINETRKKYDNYMMSPEEAQVRYEKDLADAKERKKQSDIREINETRKKYDNYMMSPEEAQARYEKDLADSKKRVENQEKQRKTAQEQAEKTSQQAQLNLINANREDRNRSGLQKFYDKATLKLLGDNKKEENSNITRINKQSYDTDDSAFERFKKYKDADYYNNQAANTEKNRAERARKEAYENTKNKVIDTVNDVKDFSDKVINKTKDISGRTYNTIKDFSSKAVDGLKDRAKDTIKNILTEENGEKAIKWLNNLSDNLENKMNKSLKGIMDMVPLDIKNSVGSFLGGLFKKK